MLLLPLHGQNICGFVKNEFTGYFKAGTRNFHLLLILAAPVDGNGMETAVSRMHVDEVSSYLWLWKINYRKMMMVVQNKLCFC